MFWKKKKTIYCTASFVCCCACAFEDTESYASKSGTSYHMYMCKLSKMAGSRKQKYSKQNQLLPKYDESATKQYGECANSKL